MGVVVIIIIGVRMVVSIIIVLIILLLPILHHCVASYYIVVTNIAPLCCSFLRLFRFIKFKYSLNFVNYLLGNVALFYLILQGIM